MKRLLATATAAIVLLGSAPTIAKQDKNPPILVDAGNLTAQWAQDVSQDLDRELMKIRPAPREILPNGLVQIRFEVADGHPVNVRVHRQSGYRWLDRQAVRSVERLNNMSDIPYTADNTRTVQANIITARDEDAFRDLHDELIAVEEARMASSGPDRTVIALNPGSRRAG